MLKRIYNLFIRDVYLTKLHIKIQTIYFICRTKEHINEYQIFIFYLLLHSDRVQQPSFYLIEQSFQILFFLTMNNKVIYNLYYS